MYIDLDSGTVFSGPVYFVEIPDADIDGVMDSDQGARDYALAYGKQVW